MREQESLVALSFDDGPGRSTASVLDVLRRHGMVATFFVIGRRVAGREAVLRRMVAEGSEIGNHTHSHAPLEELSRLQIAHELHAASAEIERATGQAPKLMRPPRGLGSARAARVAEALGMTLVLWSRNPKDWMPSSRSPEIAAAVEVACAGDVIVLHDSGPEDEERTATVQALEAALPRLLARGFEFVTVSELLARTPAARRRIVPPSGVRRALRHLASTAPRLTVT